MPNSEALTFFTEFPAFYTDVDISTFPTDFLSPIANADNIIENIYSFFNTSSLLQKAFLVNKKHKKISQPLLLETSLIEFLKDLDSSKINLPINLPAKGHFEIKILLRLVFRDGHHPTPLALVAAMGCLKAVKLALKMGAEINHVDTNFFNYTPLFFAALSGFGKVEVIRYLVENGANIYHKNSTDSNVLLMLTTKLARNRNYADIANYLADLYQSEEILTNVNKRGMNFMYPLSLGPLTNVESIEFYQRICTKIIISNQHNLVKAIISQTNIIQNEAFEAYKKFVKLIRENNKGNWHKPLNERSSNVEPIIALVEQYGEKLYNSENNPFPTIIRAGSHRVLEYLLQKDMAFMECSNVPDNQGNTPLHHAILKGDPKMVLLFLNHLAEFRQHITMSVEGSNVIDKMVRYKAKVPNQNNVKKQSIFQKNDKDFTPLQLAKDLLTKAQSLPYKGNQKALKKIYHLLYIAELEWRGTINTPDNQGNTPLHLAVRDLNFQLVKLLVANDANLLALNNDDRTPIDLSNEILESLKETCEYLDIKLVNKIKEFLNNKLIQVTEISNDKQEVLDDNDSSFMQPH